MQPKKTPAQVAPKVAVPKPELPKFSREELHERDRWERVVDMAKKGRLEALKGFLSKVKAESESANSEGNDDQKKWLGQLPEWMAEDRKLTPTMLHVAASHDQSEIVQFLLADMEVDPTLEAFQHPENGPPPRTAYECSASRSTRNVFRRAYADHPDRWNWTEGARVPSQLTEEMESVQNAKKTERKSKLKDKLKERQAEREMERQAQEEIERTERQRQQKLQDEARRASTSTAPQRLGGAAPLAVLNQTQLKGLSDEQKMRIERERRARAAEARLQGRAL